MIVFQLLLAFLLLTGCFLADTTCAEIGREVGRYQKLEERITRGICSVFSAFPDRLFLGTLVLTEVILGSVTISGKITDLPKYTEIGFHVHEFGNFSDTRNFCDSAGAHFNPYKTQHGCPEDGISHAGDLGNVRTDINGLATVFKESSVLTLGSGISSIMGRSLVFHRMKDDCGKGKAPNSSINGNSGVRVACCGISRSA